MHTSPVTQVPPEVLADRDAGLVAAFEMLCERMGNLEEMAEHWLRRERDTEWTYNGKVDSQLLGLHDEVYVWRNKPRPVRPSKETWQTVNIAMSDLTPPANFLLNETRRLKTREAMLRLGLDPFRLWMALDTVKCSDVGLDSDFNSLVDAVSEEMLRAAVEREAGGLTMIGYAKALHPSTFLLHQASKPPQYWAELGSRLFESCGIAPGPLAITVLDFDLMRVVVPFERSRNAASHKQRDLVLKSKAVFQTVTRFRKTEEPLRFCDFIEYDSMLADFRRV